MTHRPPVSSLSLRSQGISNHEGYKAENVENMMRQDAGNIIGRHMNTAAKNLELATAAFDSSSENLFKASDKLHAQMDLLSKRAKEAVSRAKDQTAQMTDAMNKITKLIGPDFEKRLSQLQQLTECMERLSALSDAGKLSPVLEALKATK